MLRKLCIKYISGSCVEKTEVIPTVTWKDIYRLILNGEKIINYQTYYGPLLRIKRNN